MTGDAVIRFLLGDPRDFCSFCLALAIGVPASAAVLVTHRVGRRRRVHRRRWGVFSLRLCPPPHPGGVEPTEGEASGWPRHLQRPNHSRGPRFHPELSQDVLHLFDGPGGSPNASDGSSRETSAARSGCRSTTATRGVGATTGGGPQLDLRTTRRPLASRRRTAGAPSRGREPRRAGTSASAGPSAPR